MTPAELVARWMSSSAAERANKDLFLTELCDVLGVPRPDPKVGDRLRDRYVFEADAVLHHPGGLYSVGKMDLYREGAFILEAKQGSIGPGAARRGSATWNIAMRDAMGQALGYARTLAQPPPFLVVVDIGHCIDLYATFDGTLNYRPWRDGLSARIWFTDLPQHVDLLRALWLDPHSLDPSRQKVKVTREIAGLVATLSAALESRGHEPGVVARFLMRCLFTMFAEDIGLLSEKVFTRMLRDAWLPDPSRFVPELGDLWRAMDQGGRFRGPIKRFNGGLFRDPVVLPLQRAELDVLAQAADCAWDEVEPAIFGTLLERALSPRERHRLGAHYTPRAYVERLVRATVETPLRWEWDLVRVQARTLVLAGKADEAREAVADFYHRLCHVTVLDPACGTGNFLYVALDLLQRLESEVVAHLRELGDLRFLMLTVGPRQCLGIEKKPWAKEIAELVLWIGHLTWRVHGRGELGELTEPILAEHGTVECRDAVLDWSRTEPELDATGAPRTRWDGETVVIHPVTGKSVPDDTARVPVLRYLDPRQAVWPAADFIVGNPPFIGNKRMRDALGDGYAEALRTVWPEVPATADLVMYWWRRAGQLCVEGKIRRFGLITTNSITQVFNRGVVESLCTAGLAVRWAVPDHPWVVDGAAVRIAMTVAEKQDVGFGATLLTVTREDWPGSTGESTTEGTEDTEAGSRRQRGANEPTVELAERFVDVLHADLRAGANVAGAVRLRANMGLSFQGMNLVGEGFRLTPEEVTALGFDLNRLPSVLRPYRNARDITQGGPPRYVIDFYGLSAEQAAAQWPSLYQHLLVHVKPERDQNNRDSRRKNWWLFGETVGKLRAALVGLHWFIVTPKTAKHRTFLFEEVVTTPDSKLYAIGTADASVLAVLSSRLHLKWALATGAFLEDRPTYNNQTCFEQYPFPLLTDAQRAHLADLGERLDAHRKSRQLAHPTLTLTGMYNVLDKLRRGAPLTDKERVIHDQGLVSVLRELHDQIDAAVLGAYGWPQGLDDEALLEKLVTLNTARAAEERAGLVRWLRPELQQREVSADLGLGPAAAELEAPKGVSAWPGSLAERIRAVREGLPRAEAVDVETVSRWFKKAPRKEVEAILESLGALGLLVTLDGPDGRRWRAAG